MLGSFVRMGAAQKAGTDESQQGVEWLGAGFRCRSSLQAHIAQSVEHFLGKEEVTGSNPVMSSIALAVVQVVCGGRGDRATP
jgi:hypothetical protein